MGIVITHPEVKLIVGFISKDPQLFTEACLILKKRFGAIDFESRILPFNLTDYYEKEFGTELKRKFISFKKLIAPESLREIKIITNKKEKKLSRDNKRTINIDPGYLDLAKLVLASTKDYRHRIYAGKGVFTEVTLFYQNKSFQSWEWTYPDYRTPEYIDIFNKIRELYQKQTPQWAGHQTIR